MSHGYVCLPDAYDLSHPIEKDEDDEDLRDNSPDDEPFWMQEEYVEPIVLGETPVVDESKPKRTGGRRKKGDEEHGELRQR